MRLFLRKFVQFLLFFSIFCVALNLFFKKELNKSVNEIYSKKEKYLIENKDKFNTIYMGSSRIYRQLDPNIIDSVLADYNISSFNLGAPATYNPEQYALYEELLLSDGLQLKYAFLELQSLQEIAMTNLLSNRNYYFLDFKNLKFALLFTKETDKTLFKKIYFYLTYTTSYLLNIIIPDKYSDITKEIKSDAIKPSGYYSLSAEFQEGDEFRGVGNRRIKFQKDTSGLKIRINKAKESFSTNPKKIIINNIHLKELNYLISLSKSKNIKLFFVILPKQEEYYEIADLKNALPDNTVIEIADFNKYPYLYESEYSFDVGHLNEQGSKLLSIEFAKKFESIIK